MIHLLLSWIIGLKQFYHYNPKCIERQAFRSWLPTYKVQLVKVDSELSSKHNIGWSLTIGVIEPGAISQQKKMKSAIPDSFLVREKYGLITVYSPFHLTEDVVAIVFLNAGALQIRSSFLEPNIARVETQNGKSSP